MVRQSVLRGHESLQAELENVESKSVAEIFHRPKGHKLSFIPPDCQGCPPSSLTRSLAQSDLDTELMVALGSTVGGIVLDEFSDTWSSEMSAISDE